MLRGGLLWEHKRKQAAMNGKPLLCCLFIPVEMFGSTCYRTCLRVPLTHTHTHFITMSIISIFKSSCVIETSDMHKRKPHEKRVEAQASADRWMRVHYRIQAMVMHLYIKYIIHVIMQVVFLYHAFHITISTKSCMLAELWQPGLAPNTIQRQTCLVSPHESY